MARSRRQGHMQPGIRSGDVPPFHKIGEYVFQDLCRELVAVEPRFSTCDPYGKRGEWQGGIDLLARRKDRQGIEVIQCKCHLKFPPAKIRDSSDDFLKHWDCWSKQKVKRFILCVACRLESQGQQDEISAQEERFRQLGLDYEAWGADTILTRLRTQPAIVRAYCKPEDYWEKEICGAGQSNVPVEAMRTGQQSQVTLAIMAQGLEQVGAAASHQVESHLATVQAAWREGRRKEARDWVGQLRKDQTFWAALPPRTRARILRFEAAQVLEAGNDIIYASQLIEQVRALAPEEADPQLLAQLAYAQEGPHQALAVLAEQDTVQALSLRMAILLELGQLDACRDLMARTQDADDAGLLHARSLVHLAERDLPKAQLEIRKALDREPRWYALRFTAAALDFYGCLSPAVLPGRIVPWPEPVDWAFVNRDDEALARLRSAAVTFAQLARNPDAEGPEREALESWQLACLANDPEQRQQATAYCRQLLEHNPDHCPAIVWATVRRLDVDRDTVEKTLQQLMKQGEAKIPHVLALATLLVDQGRAMQAAQLLEDAKSLFSDPSGEALWRFWHVQALVASGSAERALEDVGQGQLAAPLWHLRIGALQVLARHTEDLAPVVSELEQAYTSTGHAAFLLDLCHVKSHLQDWNYVADRAEELVAKIGTPEAVQVAVACLNNAGRYASCLALLDSCQGVFAERKLPGYLQRMRVKCEYAVGTVPRAISDAETLANEEPTGPHLADLFDLYLATGNLSGIVQVGRRFLEVPDIDLPRLLTAAQCIAYQDPQMAIALWHLAQKRNIPDELVGYALTVGYALGLDRELGPLTRRLQRLGAEKRAGIQAFTLNEVVQILTDQNRQMQKAWDLYKKGQILGHMLAAILGEPLAYRYHGLLQEHEMQTFPRDKPPLLARHGGKAMVAPPPQEPSSWNLHVDITSILLAQHLDILDLVEAAFAPLRIPADLVPAIMRMERLLVPNQPSRLHVCQEILDLVQQGLVAVRQDEAPEIAESAQPVDIRKGLSWKAEAARKEGGYLATPLAELDMLPATDKASVRADTSDVTVNIKAIVTSLRDQGPLPQSEYEKAIETLGQEGQEPVSRIPRQGQALLCDVYSLETLSAAGLLKTASTRFRIHMFRAGYDEVRAVLDRERSAGELRTWLGTLLSRLHMGVNKGTYQQLPIAIATRPDGPLELPEERCLLGLIQEGADSGAVAWVDDRWVNGHGRIGTMPIIGISEILQALRVRGLLNDQQYYEKLLALRAGNVCFIPLSSEEILYHLREARTDGNAIVETRALVVLREYICGCLLLDGVVQWPPMPPDAPSKLGELPFVSSISRAIGACLANLWNTDDDLAARSARAEWLLRELYLDDLGMLLVAGATPPTGSERYIVSLGLAALIAAGFDLPARGPDGRRGPRRAYFSWIYEYILHKRFAADRDLLPAVIRHLKMLLSPGHDTQHESEAFLAAVRMIYRDLPGPVRAEVEKDADFLRHIGIQFRTVANLEGLVFEPQDFAGAVRMAINGQNSNLKVLEPEFELTLEPARTAFGRPAFKFVHPIRGHEEVVAGIEFELLLEPIAAREAAMRHNRGIFDYPNAAFEQVISEITIVEDPVERLERARSQLARSAVAYYESVGARIRAAQTLSYPDLVPPDVRGLLRHLRLAQSADTAAAFPAALTGAAKVLLVEEGLAEATQRLAGLPVPLPEPLVQALADCSPTESRRLLLDMARRPGSPVSRMHLLHLLSHVTADSRLVRRLSRLVIAQIARSGRQEFAAFTSVLTWAAHQFSPSQMPDQMPARLRLVLTWMHAHKLFALFSAAGVDSEQIEKVFRDPSQVRIINVVTRDPDFQLDVACPGQIGYPSFLAAGLSYGLAALASQPGTEWIRELLAKAPIGEDVPAGADMLNLMHDPALGRNCLGSFLGGDRGRQLAPLIGAEAAEGVSSAKLHAIAMDAVTHLHESHTHLDSWLRLHAVIHDFPPYDDISLTLTSVILETDFGSWLGEDPNLALVPMVTACSQAATQQDARLGSHLAEQLPRLARLIAGRRHQPPVSEEAIQTEWELQEVAQTLVWCMLNAATAGRSSEAGLLEFARLLRDMADAWPEAGTILKPLVQRLAGELPANLSKAFGPLLVHLRRQGRS